MCELLENDIIREWLWLTLELCCVVFQLRLCSVTSVILVLAVCATQLKSPAYPLSNASAVSVKQVQSLCFPNENKSTFSHEPKIVISLSFIISAGFLEVKMKGCLAVAQCNKTENVNFPSNSSTVYTMTKTCCNTDLCNSAPGRSHVSALMMTLTAIAVKFIM